MLKQTGTTGPATREAAAARPAAEHETARAMLAECDEMARDMASARTERVSAGRVDA
ncbi:MAG TPA: hypothetical protein VE631_01420 [Alphaproteobacteria bacterium]|jgi:hypothetical protein|nr:hypothetical protein [Alphaproteobacteria bacterium]